jgi:hypothetical protein
MKNPKKCEIDVGNNLLRMHALHSHTQFSLSMRITTACTSFMQMCLMENEKNGNEQLSCTYTRQHAK